MPNLKKSVVWGAYNSYNPSMIPIGKPENEFVHALGAPPIPGEQDRLSADLGKTLPKDLIWAMGLIRRAFELTMQNFQSSGLKPCSTDLITAMTVNIKKLADAGAMREWAEELAPSIENPPYLALPIPLADDLELRFVTFSWFDPASLTAFSRWAIRHLLHVGTDSVAAVHQGGDYSLHFPENGVWSAGDDSELVSLQDAAAGDPLLTPNVSSSMQFFGFMLGTFNER